MKKEVLVIAFLLTVCFVGFAFGQSNEAFIEQVGKFHESIQEQKGGSNLAHIWQGWGDRNTGLQYQDGRWNKACLVQHGAGNVAFQHQKGNCNNGGGGFIYDPITQLGHKELYYGIYLHQIGLDNDAIQIQKGNGNYNFIYQEGTHKAVVEQEGCNLSHVLFQLGPNPQGYLVKQTGMAPPGDRPVIIVKQF
jgi:hypothetical protein